MKVSKEFAKVLALMKSIDLAKQEAKKVISDIADERNDLDDLESQAKLVLKA